MIYSHVMSSVSTRTNLSFPIGVPSRYVEKLSNVSNFPSWIASSTGVCPTTWSIYDGYSLAPYCGLAHIGERELAEYEEHIREKNQSLWSTELTFLQFENKYCDFATKRKKIIRLRQADLYKMTVGDDFNIRNTMVCKGFFIKMQYFCSP